MWGRRNKGVSDWEAVERLKTDFIDEKVETKAGFLPYDFLVVRPST